MVDNNVEPMTPEEIERFRSVFKALPLVAVPKEDVKVAKALNEIAMELKKIRVALERRR